ncbi:MAG: ABC transporter permease, partial [Bacteroidota bacterium]
MEPEKDYIEITGESESLWAYLARVWRYRALARVLALREIKIQYSQTLLGIGWAVIQPVVAILIYTFFFYKLLQIKTGDVPYPVFVLPGVMAWFHFSQILSDAGSSLQKSQDLIKKVEFPRIILPIAQVLYGLTFVVISFILMLILLAIFQTPITYRIVFFPIFLALNTIVGMTVAIWLSAMSFRYRDLHHIVPYLINFLIWVTPVFYPTTILGPDYEHLIYVNPLAGIIAGFRWCLTGGALPGWEAFLPLLPILLLFFLGVRYFKQVERHIEDY